MNATRNVDLNCIVCGTAILDAQRRTKKYCSNDCSNARRREHYVPKPIGNNWVPLRDRLYSRALIKPTGCVEWQGYRLRYGHGQIMVRNEDGTTSLTTTHRAAWMIERGPIPEGLVVRHKCDNPPCVNIAHLELGTAADNSRDAVERGRVARGSALPQTVLTEDDVRNIRAEYRRFTIPGRRGYHTNKRQLAKKYGGSPGHIKEIVGRRERADVA